MRLRRVGRLRAVAVGAAAALLVTLVAPTIATAAAPRVQLSNKACDAFADYFTIEFLVAFASAFAGLGEDLGSDSGRGSGNGSNGGGKESVSAKEIADTFHLVFSPKLANITGTLADEGPRSIRRLFAKQRDVFEYGVELLRKAGLSNKQISALATLDLSPDTDLDEVLGETDIPEKKIEEAADQFGERTGELDLNDEATPRQQRAFQRAGSGCGVFPDSDIDCESLVPSELAAPLVGGEPDVTNDDGSCTYTGPSPSDNDEPVLAVDVYPSARTFERLIEQLQGGQKIDDDAYVTEGFSSFSSIKTCGRTLYSRTDRDTVVVALCPPGDGEVADADLIAVRDAVVAARS